SSPRRHARACRGHPRLPPPYPPPLAGEGREGEARKAWMAWTSPAMTPNKWFNLTGMCSRSGITRVTYDMLRGAIFSVAVLIAVCAGSSRAQEHVGAAYGHWGFDESGIDPRFKPGDSFFDFANGAWDARTVIPADKSRFGMFDALTDKTEQQVHAIIEGAAKSGASLDTDAGKIGAL